MAGTNQVTYGKPVDLNADIPIFPPFALLLALLSTAPFWLLVGRMRWVPGGLRGVPARLAVLAGLVAVVIGIITQSGKALEAAGSGIKFVPVDGLATDGIYAISRNPMYTGLVFAMPVWATILDSAWPLLTAVPLFLYLDRVVIRAEEAMLQRVFDTSFKAYCERTPRWLVQF